MEEATRSCVDHLCGCFSFYETCACELPMLVIRYEVLNWYFCIKAGKSSYFSELDESDDLLLIRLGFHD